MPVDYKIRGEKLQYNINIEAAKISALSLVKTDIHMNILQVRIYYLLIKVE